MFAECADMPVGGRSFQVLKAMEAAPFAMRTAFWFSTAVGSVSAAGWSVLRCAVVVPKQGWSAFVPEVTTVTSSASYNGLSRSARKRVTRKAMHVSGARIEGFFRGLVFSFLVSVVLSVFRKQC